MSKSTVRAKARTVPKTKRNSAIIERVNRRYNQPGLYEKGLETLAGTKVATVAGIAAINFEPISPETLEQLQSVTDEDWQAHLWTIRLALVALSKSKEEMKEIAKKIMADEDLNPIERFKNSIGFLTSGVEFLTTAKIRLLRAGVAVVAEGAQEARS